MAFQNPHCNTYITESTHYQYPWTFCSFNCHCSARLILTLPVPWHFPSWERPWGVENDPAITIKLPQLYTWLTQKYYRWPSKFFCGIRYMSYLSKTYFRTSLSSKLLKWRKTEEFMCFVIFFVKKYGKNVQNLKSKPYFFCSPWNKKITVHGLKVAKHP